MAFFGDDLASGTRLILELVDEADDFFVFPACNVTNLTKKGNIFFEFECVIFFPQFFVNISINTCEVAISCCLDCTLSRQTPLHSQFAKVHAI